MLQIKTIPKNISTSYISELLSFIYLTTISEGRYKLSEEVTKHTHSRYNSSSLTITIYSIADNKHNNI